MSSTQQTASPRAPRARHHQHSKSATQPPAQDNRIRGQRRQKGNGNPVAAQKNGANVYANVPASAGEGGLADSAVLSNEQATIPTGSRNARKQLSQSSVDRRVSPAAFAAASMADAEQCSTQAAATPAKLQGAYAGPTFHASPAPSALPIPKFLSKSVPTKARVAPTTPPLEECSDSASSPSPSPSRASITIPTRHQDSPLDMLFKAHRAETARSGSYSPASANLSSPIQLSGNSRPQHVKHDSHGSPIVPFPIDLDGDSKQLHNSPPAASPVAHRSITAPSKIPQMGDLAKRNDDSGAIHDLLTRLSMSQNKSSASTPGRAVDHLPSDPSLRNHAPSPFHNGQSPFISASGPTTPAPPAQEISDFFYGNRNLSPLFKAVQTDSPKRNSGLRTEVTADSPAMVQGGFTPGPPVRSTSNNSRPILGNALQCPANLRRGSAPQIQPIQQPYRGSPKHQGRGQVRRSYHPSPDFYPARLNGTTNEATNGTPPVLPKASSVMCFVPSSVRAKPQAPTPPKQAVSDTQTLEQDLKRLLNLPSGDLTGVRQI